MMDLRTLALILVVALTAACADAQETDAGPATDAGAATAGAVEASSAESGVEREVVYVDVRTPREYAAGHVEGAINIPHTEIRERHDELEAYADGPDIVVYCRSGRRSGIAQGILEEEGFSNVENGGGLRDLRAQGVPTTR